MISRSNAHDSVSPDKMKDFCRKSPCSTASRRALDFTRIDFGWLHGFGRSAQSYIGPDILEFVLSRGAAWGCPFSMTANLKQLATNPLTEDCFDVIKIWEDARIGNKLTDSQREDLKNLEQEHHLFINEKNEYELVPIDSLPGISEDTPFKAYSFQRESRTHDTYVLIWPLMDKIDLILPINSNRLTLMKPFGTRLPLKSEEGKTIIPLCDRKYLVFSGMEIEQVRKILGVAKAMIGKTTVEDK